MSPLSPAALRAVGFVLGLLSPHAEAIAGDLLEEHALVQARRGPAAARLWLTRELLASLWPLARRKLLPLLPALLAGALCFALALAGCAAFWHLLLAQVPLRADHAPPLSHLLCAALLSLFAALCGYLAARALAQGPRRLR